MKRLILITVLIVLISGCEKFLSPPGKSLDFYIIKDFERIGTTYKIDNSSVKLSDSIIISYDEIISYNSKTYTFTVTGPCADRLTDFENNHIHGMPFAVTIDKEIIYTGYFWCGFSSAMVDWITIDPLNYSGTNILKVRLGYPGIVIGDYIPDDRNDKRILKTLRRDNKLID